MPRQRTKSRTVHGPLRSEIGTGRRRTKSRTVHGPLRSEMGTVPRHGQSMTAPAQPSLWGRMSRNTKWGVGIGGAAAVGMLMKGRSGKGVDQRNSLY